MKKHIEEGESEETVGTKFENVTIGMSLLVIKVSNNKDITEKSIYGRHRRTQIITERRRIISSIKRRGKNKREGRYGQNAVYLTFRDIWVSSSLCG